MSLASYIVFLSGVVLEALVVCRLLMTGLWRRYSFFFAYVSINIFETFLGFLVLKYAPSTMYAKWYWTTGILNLGLRFFIIWEVFRHTFPEGLPLRRMVSAGFTITTLTAMTLWGTESYGKFHSLPLALERSFGFAQAVLILAILFSARYYQLPLGRNIWGIAIAFGMQSSLSTVNSALMDVVHSFLPYWRLLDPLTVVAMIGMWTWAIWVYAPNPSIMVQEDRDNTDSLRRWSEDWGQTVSMVRKVTHP